MSGRVALLVDGERLEAEATVSLAAALLAAGRRRLRTTPRGGEPRGLFCGMGVCFDCLVTVDGRPGVRACLTRVRDGMRVETR
jgi:predicted molibdopterin-dependent oxidoreductase YjgC